MKQKRGERQFLRQYLPLFLAGKTVMLYTDDGPGVLAIAETTGGKRLGARRFDSIAHLDRLVGRGNMPGRLAEAIELVTHDRIQFATQES